MISHVERPILADQIRRVANQRHCQARERDFLQSVLSDLLDNQGPMEFRQSDRAELWNILEKYAFEEQTDLYEITYN
jgi:hypothetical protein